MNIEVEPDEITDIVQVESHLPATNRNDEMMLKVIESGNIEALERFIALKEREESRHASLEFDRHFAEMQADFVPASRSKKGYDYRYAPVEALQKQHGPIISAHGFSYRWKEESIETGKRCTLIISGHGSSRENSFDVPMITGTKQMNPIQVAGAMSTYGRRYTFISGFGVIIEDEDTDGYIKPQAPQGDSIDAWEKTWLSRIDGLTTDDGHRAELIKIVKDAKKSRNHDDAVIAMDKIKAAINGN